MVWSEESLEHRALAVHEQKEYLTVACITQLGPGVTKMELGSKKGVRF